LNVRQPSISASWNDNFLPQVGAVYNVNARDQVFASYSQSMALPRGADDIFSQASPAAPGPKAEKAKNLEAGYRANRPTFNASIVGYQTTFDNRLQAYSALVPGSTTTETFYQNVGGVKAYGAEFSGQWKPTLLQGKVYFNSNLSYNVSEFQDNFASLAIKGNRVPDFPDWVFQGGVTLEPVSWAIINFSARHISSRFTNYTNTETTNGYTIYNAYVDLGGFDAGPFAKIKARFNVDNLTDEDYLGTISAPMVATPAFFRPGPRRTMQFTLSADF
jgi:iron complex outermembrane receptor protein